MTSPIALKFQNISERYGHYNIQSRSFETSRDLALRRLTACWIETQVSWCWAVSSISTLTTLAGFIAVVFTMWVAIALQCSRDTTTSAMTRKLSLFITSCNDAQVRFLNFWVIYNQYLFHDPSQYKTVLTCNWLHQYDSVSNVISNKMYFWITAILI